MTGPDLRAAAATLARHRATARALPGFPGKVPETLAAAYQMQAAAVEALGRPVAGWKVGLLSRDLAERFGEDRFVGPIFMDSVVEAGLGHNADFPVILGGTALVEAELVANVERLSGGVYRTKEWRIAIEVAGSPVADIGKLGSLASIAAFGNNIGLILGPPVSLDDPGEAACTVELDGVQVGCDTAARLPGGPTAAIDFAIEKLSALDIAPSESLLISTGAITGMHPVTAGQLISARFDPGGLISAKAMPAG